MFYIKTRFQQIFLESHTNANSAAVDASYVNFLFNKTI